MNTNKNFHIIKNLGLIIVSHDEIINQESIETVISDLIGNPFFKRNYKVLIDVRNSEIKMTSDEIEVLSSFVFNKLKATGIKKFALLVKTSQINKAAEFVHYYRQPKRYRVFSSFDSALYWLGIPMERKSQVKIILTYLEKNYVFQLN